MAKLSALVATMLAATAIVASLGCSASKSWDGKVYHGGRTSFRTGPLSSTWERIDLDGPLLAFHDTKTGGTIDVYGRCGQDGDDVPLSALTKHLLIGFTEREVQDEKTVPMDGREALHTVVSAKLDGSPVTLSLYVIKKDGCVFDLVYVARPARYADGVAAFEEFVSGFGTVGG
jgi:hypothetical protein